MESGVPRYRPNYNPGIGNNQQSAQQTDYTTENVTRCIAYVRETNATYGYQYLLGTGNTKTKPIHSSTIIDDAENNTSLAMVNKSAHKKTVVFSYMT